MSDYNGPCRSVRVRFTREWHGVPLGFETPATFYPELGTYYVNVLNGQFIGTHPTHAGLLELVSNAKEDRP